MEQKLELVLIRSRGRGPRQGLLHGEAKVGVAGSSPVVRSTEAAGQATCVGPFASRERIEAWVPIGPRSVRDFVTRDGASRTRTRAARDEPHGLSRTSATAIRA